MTPDMLFEQLLVRVAIDPAALSWLVTLIDIHNLPELDADSLAEHSRVCGEEAS